MPLYSIRTRSVVLDRLLILRAKRLPGADDLEGPFRRLGKIAFGRRRDEDQLSLGIQVQESDANGQGRIDGIAGVREAAAGPPVDGQRVGGFLERFHVLDAGWQKAVCG